MWRMPPVDEVWKAIDIYLTAAYAGEAELPSAVRHKLETLRAISADDFFDSPVLECEKAGPPRRFAIRLGNRGYPHMKMAIERTPDGAGHLFRADTHDTHCAPQPGTREFRQFGELMARNQQIAQAIESAWAEADLPTFKTYLRRDLEKRGR